MGGRDSYSKRKSSKRKRNKTSSQKKSRRKESKKHSRIHDSFSSYSDDSSSNSEHTSSSTSKSNHKRIIHKSKKLRRDYSTSSSSHDQSMSSGSGSSSEDYKRTKARHSRPNLKSNKKRARQRSARRKGDGDAHSGRKRKRSNKDGLAKPKKYSSSKKKPKKHLSTSSSSDSESCSTCKSNSSSSNADLKCRKSKIILGNERERPRGRELYKSSKKCKRRSPSCSPCDIGSKHSEGALSPAINNNFRRLRSVIAVVDQRYDEGEENRWEKDPHKEEIVYDQNDYPSPKSLDSNEGGTKMELDNQSHDVSSKIVGIGNIAGEEITELGKSRINEGDKDNDGDHQLKAVDMNNFEKEKEVGTSILVASLGGDVLESILRQKALENLKKFKGRLQTGETSTNNLKMNNESDVAPNVMVENVQNKSTKQEANSNVREVNQNSGLSQKSDISQLTEVKKLSDSENVEKMNWNSGLSQKRDLSQLNEVKKLPDSENDEKMNRNAGLSQKRDISQLTEVKKLLNSENVGEMNRNSGLSRKRDISQLKEVKRLSGSENFEKEYGMDTQTVEHPTRVTALLECSKEDEYVSPDAVLAEPLSRTNTYPGAESTNIGSNSVIKPCSSIGPMTEEHSLERGNEGKDGSQFEQKTMSVMRGGEMVQVSYKVYIPKKDPALARKPLRR